MQIVGKEVRIGELITEPGSHAVSVRTRPTVEIRLRDSVGRTGVGEASPLPGYSPDSFEEALAYFASFPGAAVIEENHPTEFLERADALVSGAPSSARFAVETALLDLLGQRSKKPLWALLASHASPPTLPLAAVFDDPSDVVAVAARVGPVHTAKIKVGRNWEREREVAATVLRHMNVARLRFDYNRRLDESTLPSLDELSAFDPEFVEEPGPGSEWTAMRTAPVPLALDETLQEDDAIDRIEQLGSGTGPIRFCVVKPSTCGGILRSSRIVSAARKHGLDVVVSHTLEGEVARTALTHLAFAWMDGRVAAGLGPDPGVAIRDPLLVRPTGPGLHPRSDS